MSVLPAKCIGTATRLNMQYGIDCNITVEFISAIIMGRGYFISADAVAMWVGEQRSKSGE
jgi:hypothetical protein